MNKHLKKLVFINQTLSLGGAEIFNSQLLKSFRDSGLEVTAWTNNENFRKILSKSGIKNYKIPIVVDIIGDWKGFLKGIILFLPAFLYYGRIVFKNIGQSAFFLSGYIEKILVTPWAKLIGAPVIWVEHGPNALIFSKFFGIPGFLYSLVSKMPNAIVTPSNHTKKENKLSAEVIPDGITPLNLSPYRKKIFTAFCVSRLENGKGQDLLISAWPKVLEKFPSAKLYIIGAGDFKKRLVDLVDDLKINKSVVFTGWVTDLRKVISALTVGVFPSVWPLEGFGIVLLEAMSLKKPIICFNSPPYNEVVDGSSAILIKKGDINKLSEAIIKVFTDKDLAKKIGLSGYRRFQKLFTIQKCSQEYLKLIYSLEKDLTQNRFQVYLYDLRNKGFSKFVSDRIKKRKYLRKIYYILAKDYVYIDGRKLYVDVMDTVISERLISEGIWEPGTTKVFKKYAKGSRLIVDVGANIGYYTLIASEVFKKSGRVVAFEPSKINYGLLNRTVNENGFKNVVLVNKAIGEVKSTKVLYSGNENFGDRRMFKTSSKESGEKVNVISLDDYFSNGECIDLLKIDIQGYEVKALRGAKKLLAENKIKVIISELEPDSLRLAGNSWYEYFEILKSSGFQIFNIDHETGVVSPLSKDEISERYESDSDLTLNILAINKNEN